MPALPTTPWNKDRRVGARTEFTQSQLLALCKILNQEPSAHDLALFVVGIDTMLRVSDLLPLKVKDLLRKDGSVKTAFLWQQQKTRNAVSPTLTQTAINALLWWVKQSGKRPNDYLFTRHKPRIASPITDDYYRKLVKRWAIKLSLDPSQYSSHSIRRTKAIFLYKRGVKVEFIAKLLGHASVATTIKYLGITASEAQALALEHDIFNPKNKPSERIVRQRNLSNSDVKRIAVQVAQELLNIDLFSTKLT